MKTRILAIAAVAVAAAFPAPANAGPPPSCVSYDALAPRSVAHNGPDLVKANFTMVNNCGAQRWAVDLVIERKYCYFGGGCDNWVGHAFLDYTVEPGAYSTMEVNGTCMDGKHRYRLYWALRDANTLDVHGYGRTSEPELTCENDDAPVPSVPCEKLGDVCRAIDPS